MGVYNASKGTYKEVNLKWPIKSDTDNSPPNILWRTKCYTIGAMEYSDGTNWRAKVENFLVPRGIVVFNPYKQSFIAEHDESPNVRIKMRAAMQKGDFETVSEWSKTIRRYDLNLVDRSDFIIAYIIPSTASWGTAEELSTAVGGRKPIFAIIEGGIKNTPLWLMGELKWKYLYNNVDEVLEMLDQIDTGKKTIDSPSWRLLKPELR